MMPGNCIDAGGGDDPVDALFELLSVSPAADECVDPWLTDRMFGSIFDR